MTQTPQTLIDQAYETADHAEAFALLQEAARLADLSGNEELGYDARDALLDAAHEVGDDVTLLTTFGWLLNYADTHPEEEKVEELFWRYKWAMAIARSLPQVPLTRIRALQDDFARRTREAGLGERTADMERWRLAVHTGDAAEAEQYKAKALAQKATWLDCDACDTDQIVRGLVAEGKLDEALKAAQPVLNWKQSCNRVPARTYIHFLLPLWRAGREDEAKDFFQRGYSLVWRKPEFLDEQAAHLAYLILSSQQAAAAKAYADHAHLAEQEKTATHLLDWYAACALDETVTGEGHAAKARAIAAQFDERNGTRHQTDLIEQLWALRDSKEAPL